jgi:hypothetical protein
MEVGGGPACRYATHRCERRGSRTEQRRMKEDTVGGGGNGEKCGRLLGKAESMGCNPGGWAGGIGWLAPKEKQNHPPPPPPPKVQ